MFLDVSQCCCAIGETSVILARGRLDALTSVRFFFAMMVVVHHFAGQFPAEFVTLPGFIYSLGPLAVSWFFVLSGFIIAYNYPELSTNKQRRDFFILRVARLWPVHCVVLTAALSFLYLTNNSYLPRHQDWLFYHYTLTQTWTMNADIATGYNGPSWSVSNELFFYIAYIGMLAPRRWLRIFVVLVPIAIGAALPIAHGCFLPVDSPGSTAGSPHCIFLVFQFPPARLIEFVSGVVICRMNVRIPQLIGLAAATAVFGNFIPPISWIGNDPLALTAVREILLVVGGGALIASLAEEGWLSRLLSFRLLVIGGEISYSIYMTHQVVNLGILPHIHGLSLSLTFLLVTTITITSSAFLFYFVEAPVRDAVKARLKTRTSATEGRIKQAAELPIVQLSSKIEAVVGFEAQTPI
jgi:peptidoglycan/LPS O-acetylase OafA/YrhL